MSNDLPDSDAPYQPPDFLPPPPEQGWSTPFLAGALGVGGAVLGGIVMCAAARFIYVYVFYNALLGVLIGRAIAAGASRSRFTNQAVLLGLTIACSLLAYVAYNAALYAYLLERNNVAINQFGAAELIVGFGSFMKLRAEQDDFIGGMQLVMAGNSVVWLIEAAITAHYAWQRVRIDRMICLVESVPAEVLQFVAHLLSEGRESDEVAQELSKRGWIVPADQQRAIRAVESTTTEV
jgi:hypothetical protein